MKKNRKKRGKKVDFEIPINEAEQKIKPKLCMFTCKLRRNFGLSTRFGVGCILLGFFGLILEVCFIVDWFVLFQLRATSHSIAKIPILKKP